MSAALRYRRMQGLSLVEVMVSLVIGLVVVGAVLVSYITAGTTGICCWPVLPLRPAWPLVA